MSYLRNLDVLKAPISTVATSDTHDHDEEDNANPMINDKIQEIPTMDSPPAKRRPRAGGTSKAEGRVAGGRKKEGKGSSFLEKWLKEGGTNKEAGRSPEEARGSEFKEEESTQGRKEMLEGRIPATNAEGRDR